LAQRIAMHQTQMPKPLGEVRRDCPRELAEMCTKMMQKDPRDRQPNCTEIVDQLSAWLSRQGQHVPGRALTQGIATSAFGAGESVGGGAKGVDSFPGPVHVESNSTLPQPIALTDTQAGTKSSASPTTTIPPIGPPPGAGRNTITNGDSSVFSIEVGNDSAASRVRRRTGASSKVSQGSAKSSGKSKRSTSPKPLSQLPVWMWAAIGIGLLVIVLGVGYVMTAGGSTSEAPPTPESEPQR